MPYEIATEYLYSKIPLQVDKFIWKATILSQRIDDAQRYDRANYACAIAGRIIPMEIAGEICKWLSWRDLVAMLRVSKGFNFATLLSMRQLERPNDCVSIKLCYGFITIGGFSNIVGARSDNPLCTFGRLLECNYIICWNNYKTWSNNDEISYYSPSQIVKFCKHCEKIKQISDSPTVGAAHLHFGNPMCKYHDDTAITLRNERGLVRRILDSERVISKLITFATSDVISLVIDQLENMQKR